MPCRICGEDVREVLDLGESPPANGLKASRDEPDELYPLVLEYCDACGNIQLRDCLDAEKLYRHYLYLTPDSASLTQHYERLTAHLAAEGHLDDETRVLEIGSNVGHFLKFLQPKVAQVLGIDPAENVCRRAEEQGIETLPAFFGPDALAPIRARMAKPNLIVARHCFAHNEDPHRLIAAVADLLPEDGVFVMENAYALDTLQQTDFGQVYHEHMFYFAIQPIMRLFEAHGLALIDLQLSPIHSGSIAFIAAKQGPDARVRSTVDRQLAVERKSLNGPAIEAFAARVRRIAEDLRGRLAEMEASGREIWAYGATAKATTLLNYVGITDRQIRFCADSTPTKQGRFIPQANIEIRPEQEAFAAKPGCFLITAWNYRDELIAKARNQGDPEARFIVPIPDVTVL